MEYPLLLKKIAAAARAGAKTLLNRPDPALREITDLFVPGFEAYSPFGKMRLKYLLLYSNLYYRISYMEYFIFHFEDLSDRGKRKYIGDAERLRVAKYLYEGQDNVEFLGNKYLCYRLLQPLYKREMIRIASEDDFSAFSDFAEKYKKVVLKPLEGSGGVGVSVIDTREMDAELLHFVVSQYFGNNGPLIAEEWIDQTPEMAAFHPASCNTVRVNTFTKDGEVHFLFSDLFLGMSGRIISNTDYDGITAPVDLQTGIVTGLGVRKGGGEYIFHPDSGAKLPGFELPDWSGLKELVTQAALLAKEHYFIGWDLAHTAQGWVVVEANGCPGLSSYQFAAKRGCREDFQKIMKGL